MAYEEYKLASYYERHFKECIKCGNIYPRQIPYCEVCGCEEWERVLEVDKMNYRYIGLSSSSGTKWYCERCHYKFKTDHEPATRIIWDKILCPQCHQSDRVIRMLSRIGRH